MRAMFCIALVLLVSAPAYAEEFIFDSTLYSAESITVGVDISGEITHTGTADRIQTKLLYYPHAFPGQNVLRQETFPPAKVEGGALIYTWNNPSSTEQFQYVAELETSINRPRIFESVPFPYAFVPPEAQRYLRSEDIIQITPEISDLASDIVGDEDDGVRVIFALGKWVKDNIEYDLNTVTAEASQTSQWTLDNRQGVCDELTSLFISMLRSQGIPARFISGIAYTNLETLDSPWGPHGWAEVWIPGKGWVPYDVTYGQYGYVDATHIAFTAKEDAQANAAEYTLYGRGKIQPSGLQRNIELLDREGEVSSDLRVDVAVAVDTVGFGSYNRIDAVVHNRRNYYVAAELFLAGTEGLTTEDVSRSILLGPNEERTVSWLVEVSDDLQTGYKYTFPIVVYDNSNQQFSSSFVAASTGTRVEAESLGTQDTKVQELQTGLDVGLTCDGPSAVLVDESFPIRCTTTRPVTLCIADCDSPLERQEAEKTFSFSEAGARSILALATQGNKESRRIVTVVVEEPADLLLEVEAPQTLGYAERGTILVRMQPNASSSVHDVVLTLEGGIISNSWEFTRIDSVSVAELHVVGKQLTAKEDTIVVTATFPSGDIMRSQSQTVTIRPQAEFFTDSIVLWVNSFSAWIAQVFG